MSAAFLPSEGVGAADRPHTGLVVHELVGGIARAADLAIVLASGLLAHAVWAGSLAPPSRPALAALAAAALLAANLFAAFRLYDPLRLGSLTYQLPRVGGAWGGTVVGVVVGTFLLDASGDIPRAWVVGWLAAGGTGLLVSRLAFRAWIDGAQRTGELARNVLVIGAAAGPGALERQDRATRVVGRLDVARLVDAGVPGALSGEGARTLSQWLLSRRIDHVALALPPERFDLLPSLLGTLRHFPVEVGLVPQLPAAGLPVLGVKQVGAMPSIMLLEKPIDGWRYVAKTIEDRVLAGLILTFIAPLMLAIALAVRLSSPGPILYRQKRLGFNQQIVEVFKFRSMYVDACDAPMSDKVVQATQDDPRVTPAGRFLRKTSLDELPQLLNVLRGEMSLVGPRPHAVAHDRHYAELIDGYLGRHRMKPGITGWAQVNGCRGETRTTEEMRQRIEYDLHYIDNWSLPFDLRIILRTLFVAFSDSKAY